jgi:hypothetical protein
MNDLILRATAKAQAATSTSVNRARSVMKGESSERGDVVQTVIIIGIFVIICVLVGAAITAAMRSQAQTLSTCIAGVNKSAGCAAYK